MEQAPAPLLILRALPKERLKAFEKFIQSPYHVTHEGVGQLYALYKSTGFEHQAARTHMAAAGGDPKRWYHWTSYLLSALEQFLALEQQQSDPAEQHAATIEALRQMQLSEPAAAMLRYAQRRLDKSPQRGAAYHRADFLLKMEAYHGSLQQGRAKDFNAQALSDAQDIAFICEKLRMGCLLLSHEAVASQTYHKGLLDSVLAFLEGHPYLDLPAVAAYYHGYYAQMGGPDSAAHFARLKTVLQEHGPLFSVAETHDLFLMAINFCIRRINQREEQYFQEVFELYQSGLRLGALLEGNVLSRWTYNNITATGLRLRAFEQVRQFLEEYAPLLPEEHREGTYHFNRARWHYELGEYRQALGHLVQIEYDDVLQNLAAKTLLCKIYYELDEESALENQLDSIQIYLRRKKVLGYHRDNYAAIVRFFGRLLKLNWNSKSEIQALRQALEEAPVLTEREWFLKKVGV